MKTTRIYPAIDIMDGKCVRLYKGDFNHSKIYSTDPVDKAKYFEASGAAFLHVVDLDGARGNGGHNSGIIESIVKNTNLKVQTGGGIRKEEEIVKLLDAGADRIVLGSIAVTAPEKVREWLDIFGHDQLVIGADMSDMNIATHGWQNLTSMHIYDFIQNYSLNGGKKFLCTDINLDGTLQGSAVELYKYMLLRFPNLDFIASGGVNSISEVRTLESIGMESIIIGKAIYEGLISMEELLKS